MAPYPTTVAEKIDGLNASAQVLGRHYGMHEVTLYYNGAADDIIVEIETVGRPVRVTTKRSFCSSYDLIDHSMKELVLQLDDVISSYSDKPKIKEPGMSDAHAFTLSEIEEAQAFIESQK